MSWKSWAKAGFLSTLLLAGVSQLLIARSRRMYVPPSHLQGHPVVYEQNVIPLDVADKLDGLMKELATFPVNTAAETVYSMKYPHIGEGQPLVNGSCTHPFLAPSPDRTLCTLPGRIDVGRHYVLSGGVEALKEPHPLLVSRVQSFIRYHWDFEKYEVMRDLFQAPNFLRLARAVCPADKQVLDPVQFNFVVNLPGQTVAAHVDAVMFWGADRFHVPQWLLAVMQFSGLFQDRFVDQVQIVAYIHRWRDANSSRAGRFVYFDDASGVPKAVPPEPLSGSSVDGSKVVHAAEVFEPHVIPPMLDKSKDSMLRWDGDGGADNGAWRLESGGELVASYTPDQLRFSIVYRARCFASEDERARYAAQKREGGPSGDGDMLPLAEILSTLKDGLVARGQAASRAALDALSPLDLATTLMDGYIRYPISHKAALPFNYCALKLKLPAAVAGLMDLIC